MKVRYEGPLAGMEVVDPKSGRSHECKRGEAIEVPKHLGDELVERGDWSRVGGTKPKGDEADVEEGED